MEEAIEICKLRLFLKLVAQVERVENIEPLPDIDFNIRAGNTLVGFATYDEIKKAVLGDAQGKFDLGKDMQRIDEKAQDVDRLFKRFREQQTELGGEVTPADKQELRNRLKALEEELNRYLAGEYGLDPNKKTDYEKWLTSHKPFHWFIEFYGIVHKQGGFDVIIGNPPYVDYGKVRRDYTIRGYQTESCGNLYAFMIERSLNLLCVNSRFSMIVPIASVSTESMSKLQARYTNLIQWHSHFAVRPGKLFVGVDMNLTITILQKTDSDRKNFVTGYRRWSSGAESDRPYIFTTLTYTQNPRIVKHVNPFPKLGSQIETQILNKMVGKGKKLHHYIVPKGVG